ncbi:MAG TPA: pseudaminic acid synthase [Thermoanaerobaculia bacterium]|nr:pseudaminic acid synthase [Thermoanaerobaculia bacterium]
MPSDRQKTPRSSIQIGEALVGAGRPVFVVAEVSANHRQDFRTACAIVEAAKESGADAIKLQTYTPETLTINCDRDCFRIGEGTIWEGRTLYDLYAEAYTPWEWQPRLKALANELGLILFSTPFDSSAVEFLETLDVPAYKIASFELVDLPLIRTAAATGKPIILSTGMATLEEIDEAVRTVLEEGNDSLALLKCTSAYPALAEEMNLAGIAHLRETFGAPVGLSDHTLGTTVPIAAVALGAAIVEKHLTLSRDDGGPDAAFSLEPKEFREMVEAVRTVEAAIGSPSYEVGAQEQASNGFRRSLFVVKDIEAGEEFTNQNIRSIRPADGLPPKHLPDVLGREAVRRLERGTPLRWEDVG